jgi:hypothetical protein
LVKLLVLTGTTEDANGCWLWQDGLLWGYGHTGGQFGERRVHRLSYMAWKGPIPEGHEVGHTCHVKRCAYPGHLEAVTHSENMRQAAVAQQMSRKLTPWQRLAIIYDPRHRDEVAEAYGVTGMYVWQLRNGRRGMARA